MALLSQGDADQPRVSCPACGTLMRAADVHSPAALAATSKTALPPHLRAAVLEIERGGGGGDGESPAGQSSSKIRRLMEVLNTAIRGRPSGSAAPGDGSAAAAAPPPAVKAAPFLGRRSKASAVLTSLAKSARPPARPPAAAAVAAPAAARGAAAPPRTGSKVIVFSQWTSMLDLVEAALAADRLPFRRLDGTMSLAARDAQLQDFKRDPDIAVLLLSLRAASLGLNLVVANHVVLLDLWWNPAVEDQAIDRAHRIGQTRDVTVTRITVKDSVEERILELQKKKREVMDAAFSDAASAGANRLTGDDLLFLFS